MDIDLRRKLDRITDTLGVGGVTNPITYIEQISYLIYLKLLDEEESQRELRARLIGEQENIRLLFPQQTERYRWSKWRFKSGIDLRDFIRDEVFPYMANSLIKDEPKVAEYFRDAVLEISDPNVLKTVVDELDTLELNKLGQDIKGDIYEYLLTHLGQSALNGQFRTPKQIRWFMVEMVDPDLGDTICDLAMGTGGFLIESLNYILAKYSESPHEIPIYGEDWLEKQGKSVETAKQENPNLQTYYKGNGDKLTDWNLLEASIYGFDVSRQMLRIAVMNLVLHGVRNAQVKLANILSNLGGLNEEDLQRRYKVLLANPPFVGTLSKDSIREDLPTHSKKSELLFLAAMMKCLAEGGRCAVVVPEGLLVGLTQAHIDLRKQLLTDFELLAVVSLPVGVFKPYTGVKTAVLVFRKPVDISEQSLMKKDSENRVQQVWFYEVKNDGFDPDKIRGSGRPETPKLNDIPQLLCDWKSYKESRFKNPPGVKAGTLLAAGAVEPRCWWVDLETIAENGYNLAAGRYKPQVAETVSNEEPAELIRELLQIEQEINTGLERLLKEVES
ncbi:type I restriction-modification system subunit M [Ancylothrix sp. C2]|uniref:type I restriction-modification system subunit M n=1 Tax=Ancylothrix sp. D3o TaxID=2953691 RepID=UPI0021BAC906|nr:class I SAM-dependent DNA methyltransferase [Ancylothrix sp. D3o]MCT7952572.1 type I restriction-modification system subunit M [Ancylothrix sp. D3o]